MDMQIQKKAYMTSIFSFYSIRLNMQNDCQHSKFAVCRLHTCKFKKMLLLKNISCG